MAAPRLTGLTALTLQTAPSVCHSCVWWQSRQSRREVDKARWMERVELESGPFGTVYSDGEGRMLGLPVIVEEHEGSISVKSAAGEGTTFTVRLPAYHETLSDPSHTHGPAR